MNQDTDRPPAYQEEARPDETVVMERPPKSLQELRQASNRNLADSPPPFHAPNEPIRHPVQPHDTIQGLAVRYGVRVADLKLWNRLMGDSIQQREFILIHSTATGHLTAATQTQRPFELYRKLLADFQRLTKCLSQEEAFLYLSEHDWELKTAMIQYQADLDWEQLHPAPSSSSSSQSHSSGLRSLGNKDSKKPCTSIGSSKDTRSKK